MEKNKKLISLLFFLFLCFFLFTFGGTVYQKLKANFEDEREEIKLITIEDFNFEKGDNYLDNYYIMKVGETFSPEMTFTPYNVSEYQKKIMWTNSDSSKLEVDYYNNFHALKPGVVTLVATSTKNIEISKTIKVKIVEEENLLKFSDELLEKTPVYSVGQVALLKTEIEGEISLYDFIWTSSNPDVATIDNGYITGKKSGYTTISCKSCYDENFEISLEIKVMGQYTTEKATKVTLNDIVTITLPSYVANISWDKFINEKIEVGYLVEFSGKTDIQNASDVYFTFDNQEMIKIIANENSKVKFEILKEGEIKFNIHSSYFPDVYTSFSFNASQQTLTDNLTLIEPSSYDFQEIDGENVFVMNKNKTQKLTIYANNKAIDFTKFNVKSSNEEVVYFKDGYIVSKNEGIAEVEVSHINSINKKITFKVKVESDISDNLKVDFLEVVSSKINESILINSYETNIVTFNDEGKIVLKLYPHFIENYDLKINFSNEELVKYETKKENEELIITFKFLDLGYTELTISSILNPYLNLYYDFLIENTKEVSFTFQKIDLLEKGEASSCNVEIPSSLKGVKISYASSNPEIVSVGKKGELVGLNYGKSEISIYATDEKTEHIEKFVVEVVEEHSLYDALETFKAISTKNNEEINLNETLFFIGDTFEITISFEPSNHPFGNYYDVIIDNDIIEVEKNKNVYTFKALQSGQCKITIYPYANSTYKTEFNLNIANIMPEFMFVSIPDEVIYVGDKYQFGYLVDWRATYGDVDIIIENNDICNIEDDYLIIKKAGQTKVTFLVDDNSTNTVSYYHTIEINAQNHSLGVLIERYGILNLIMRIIFQIISLIFLTIILFILMKKIKIENQILKISIMIVSGLFLIITSFLIRKFIPFLQYESFDFLLNIGTYFIVLLIIFLWKTIKTKKKV